MYNWLEAIWDMAEAMNISAIATLVLAVATIALVIVAYRQVRAIRRQLTFNTILRIMKELGCDEARQDRDLVYTKVKEGADPQSVSWAEEDKEGMAKAIERSAIRLDRAAYFLLKDKAAKKEAPDWIWEITFHMWRLLKPFIRYSRELHTRKLYVVYFEQLGEEAERQYARVKKTQKQPLPDE